MFITCGLTKGYRKVSVTLRQSHDPLSEPVAKAKFRFYLTRQLRVAAILHFVSNST